MSVQQAAWRIGITDRQILNYLKDRVIEGVKVGKTWHIDRASVLAHCTRYDIPEPASRPELGFHLLANTAPNPATPLAVSPQAAPSTATPPERSFTRHADDQEKPITHLKVYETFKEVMRLADPYFQSSDEDLSKTRIRDLQIKILESLGAGYYSNWGEKTNHYIAARAHIGATISLIYSLHQVPDSLRLYLQRIENDVLPMIGALIGVLFKSRAKFQSRSSNDDNGGYNKNRRWSR